MKYVKVRAPIRALLAIVSLPFWLGFIAALAPLYFGEPFEFDATTPLFLLVPLLLSTIAVTGKAPSLD